MNVIRDPSNKFTKLMFGISKLADEYSFTTYFGFNVVQMYMLPLANNNMFDSPCFALVVFGMHFFIPIYTISPIVKKKNLVT